MSFITLKLHNSTIKRTCRVFSHSHLLMFFLSLLENTMNIIDIKPPMEDDEAEREEIVTLLRFFVI